MGNRAFRFDPGWFRLGPDTTSVRPQHLPFRLDLVETMEHDSSTGSVRSLTESEMAEDLGDPVVRVVLRTGGKSEVGSVVGLDDDSGGSSDFLVVGEAAGVMLALSEESFLRDTMVFVRTMTEATISVMVNLDEPIARVRLVIGGGCGVPLPSDYRLVFGGKQLEGGMSLRDYGVQRESTLFVVMSLRGGGVTRWISWRLLRDGMIGLSTRIGYR